MLESLRRASRRALAALVFASTLLVRRDNHHALNAIDDDDFVFADQLAGVWVAMTEGKSRLRARMAVVVAPPTSVTKAT